MSWASCIPQTGHQFQTPTVYREYLVLIKVTMAEASGRDDMYMGNRPGQLNMANIRRRASDIVQQIDELLFALRSAPHLLQWYVICFKYQRKEYYWYNHASAGVMLSTSMQCSTCTCSSCRSSFVQWRIITRCILRV